MAVCEEAVGRLQIPGKPNGYPNILGVKRVTCTLMSSCLKHHLIDTGTYLRLPKFILHEVKSMAYRVDGMSKRTPRSALQLKPAVLVHVSTYGQAQYFLLSVNTMLQTQTTPTMLTLGNSISCADVRAQEKYHGSEAHLR